LGCRQVLRLIHRPVLENHRSLITARSSLSVEDLATIVLAVVRNAIRTDPASVSLPPELGVVMSVTGVGIRSGGQDSDTGVLSPAVAPRVPELCRAGRQRLRVDRPARLIGSESVPRPPSEG